MVVAQGTPCTGGRIFPTAACNVLERLCADANDLNLVEDGAVWTEAVATYGEARQPATGAICIFFKVCCLALQHTARLCNMLLGFATSCLALQHDVYAASAGCKQCNTSLSTPQCIPSLQAMLMHRNQTMLKSDSTTALLQNSS